MLRAAEAGLAQLVLTSRMSDTKIVSEGSLYETINNTLRRHTGEWVNHERKVELPKQRMKNSKRRGDDKRVDFAVTHRLKDGKVENNRAVLVEVKIGSRTKLVGGVNVVRDMEKLAQSIPKRENSLQIYESAYLIVYNITVHEYDDAKAGVIWWYGTPMEQDVKCIEIYKYSSLNFIRTAAVFRIRRKL